VIRKSIACFALLAALAAGCARNDGSLGTPRLFAPGTALDQQRNAIRYDPYPENEAGPRLTGVRPREYDRPIPEVDRSRWQNATPPGAAPAPGW
jgi:hypothetical protein